MSIYRLYSKYWSIMLIILLFPFLLYAVMPILPTHDDWVSLTSPDFSPFFIKERFLFYGYHWRPFDSMIGYIVGRNPQQLFPAFNHIVVVIGHLLCTMSVFKLLSTLRFNRTACNITTLFFFMAPATMATVTAVDSQNQVLALTTDIIAFLLYIKLKTRKYLVWILLIFLSALFKENGLMWALICPILAFGFDFIGTKTLKKDLLIGISVMMGYALIITILPKDIIIHPEYVPEVMKVVKNIIKFLFTSFVTIDYIYLLHQPSQNLLLALGTFIVALPFLYIIFIRHICLFKTKKILCTLLCLCIAVGPHVLTVFSMMHTYAGLALIAVIMAYSINACQENIKSVIVAFVMFMLAALFIDTHLIEASIQSGQTGKQMAIQAIQKTTTPAKRIYLVIIEDDYPKLSSFCVIPYEAFGWGVAAQYETGYQWPEQIQDTIIPRTENALMEARNLASTKLSEKIYDCAWIVNKENIDVISK